MTNRKNEKDITEPHEVDDSDFEELLEDFFDDVESLDKEISKINESEPDELLYKKDQ